VSFDYGRTGLSQNLSSCQEDKKKEKEIGCSYTRYTRCNFVAPGTNMAIGCPRYENCRFIERKLSRKSILFLVTVSCSVRGRLHSRFLRPFLRP
jgi:hypothetical protein